jgi:hypothetical protein
MPRKQKYVGTFAGSPYYHRTRDLAPLWAACQATRFKEKMPVGDVRLEHMWPCPRCFRD